MYVDPEMSMEQEYQLFDEDITDNAGARRMLAILTDTEVDPEDRARAAIKLGPGLQLCDERLSWDDPDLYFTKMVFEEIDHTFRSLYHDATAPKIVRRRILEAAIRAPMNWHEGAVRAAWTTDDEDWRKTGIFGMGMIPGFDDEIRQALELEDVSAALRIEIVRAASGRQIAEAEPIARQMALDDSLEKLTRLIAIESLVGYASDASERALQKLTRSSDSDIAEAARWSLEDFRMFKNLPGLDDLDDLDLDDFPDDLF